MGAAARRDQRAARCCRRPTARSTGDHGHGRAATSRRWLERHRAAGAALPARRRVPGRGGRGPARLGRRRLRQARLHPLARAVPPRARRARDGIEHLVVFPMYKQNGSRDTCFEALIVRVPWPDWIAELERTRYDNPKFVPVELVDATRGLRQRVRGAVPRDRVGRRTAGQQLRRDLLRPRGRAAAPRRPARAADLLRLNLPPDARVLLASPEHVAAGLHPLGPDPRPHPQPRRPAVRPVHDPPAGAVLDVLARGAALRPDRVRRGGRARARGRSRSPATSSTRSCFDRLLRFPITGAARPQLRRARRPAAVRLPAPRRLPALDRQPADDRLGPGRRRASPALRDEVEELYRAGIDRTKLQHWVAAHDLVAAYVPPAAGSQWAAAARDFDRRRGSAAVLSTSSATTSSRCRSSIRR